MNKLIDYYLLSLVFIILFLFSCTGSVELSDPDPPLAWPPLWKLRVK
jgi:hypothetical protein